MADEERLTDDNPTVNTVTLSDDLPEKPFRLTMELPIFLIMAGLTLSGPALNNILMYKTCIHPLSQPREECAVFLSVDPNNKTELEKDVQKYLTGLSAVKSIVEACVPAILTLFLGVWSDTHGRKPLIVWPLFGMSLTSLLVVVVSSLEHLGPWWIVMASLPLSLSGGGAILFTGILCYLSDITSDSNRSFRMTLLQAFMPLGMIAGSLASAPILRLVGNTWLIVIGAACNVFAYAFSNVYLQESLTGAVKGGISTIFDGLLVKEMVRECFKKRPNYGRAQILLLTLANSLIILIYYGASPLEYMYTREKLHWSLSDYTVFAAVNVTISSLGAFVGIFLLQNLMGFSDQLTTNISLISTLAGFVIRIFVTRSSHMYIGSGISLFKDLATPLIRSLVSKILPLTDIAKVFALMAAIEGLCPIIAPLIYNSLYRYTISVLPGAIYILSSGILGICIVSTTYSRFCWSNVSGFAGSLKRIVQYFRWNTNSQYRLLENSP